LAKGKKMIRRGECEKILAEERGRGLIGGRGLEKIHRGET